MVIEIKVDDDTRAYFDDDGVSPDEHIAAAVLVEDFKFLLGLYDRFIRRESPREIALYLRMCAHEVRRQADDLEKTHAERRGEN